MVSEMKWDDLQPLHRLVEQVFYIKGLQWGGNEAEDNVLCSYHGHLTMDSMAAYDFLSDELQPYGLMPLFRQEKDRQTIYLVYKHPQAALSKPWINLVLFALTVWSVLYAGALMAYSEQMPTADGGLIMRRAALNPLPGWPFAVSLLAILLAHEFGHYFAGRYHKTAVTLPYFIPFPFGLLGTLGAFIQMKEMPKNRRVLLDIGIAGPLAGLAVAIPVTLYGLSISSLGRVTTGFLEGNSLLYLLSKFIVFGRWLPQPVSYGGLPPFAYWLRYFFTGQPVPRGGLDVQISMVAMAGWAGILVTAMNLIPIGQLDGGHIVSALFGRYARILNPIFIVLLLGLGFLWNGWWIWAIFLLSVGGRFADVPDEITPLDTRRRWLGILALLIFLLVFSPVPFVPIA